MAKCEPYFPRQPRTAKSLGRFVVQVGGRGWGRAGEVQAGGLPAVSWLLVGEGLLRCWSPGPGNNWAVGRPGLGTKETCPSPASPHSLSLRHPPAPTHPHQTATLDDLTPDLQRRAILLKDTSVPWQAEEPGSPAQAQQGQQGQQGGSPPLHHRLQHYHYTAWPDHGVPPSPEPLLRLCEELRASGAHAAPVLVHCSGAYCPGTALVACCGVVVKRRADDAWRSLLPT